MREKDIEQKLVKAVKAKRGLCLKFVSPGMSGFPDRIILMPFGRMVFVETKSPGKKPRKLQERRHRQLRSLGFPVYVLDQADDIEGILDEVQGT